ILNVLNCFELASQLLGNVKGMQSKTKQSKTKTAEHTAKDAPVCVCVCVCMCVCVCLCVCVCVCVCVSLSLLFYQWISPLMASHPNGREASSQTPDLSQKPISRPRKVLLFSSPLLSSLLSSPRPLRL